MHGSGNTNVGNRNKIPAKDQEEDEQCRYKMSYS